MATNSSIEWTESTWNPLTGCTKISPGCKHCYAERMSHRLQAMGQPNYSNGFKLTLHEHALELPLRWKKPQTIFVNSMSDLFHKSVPVAFVLRTFDIMRRADWHQYQILTKRSDRLLELSPLLPWMPHMWMGVSIENEKYISRIDHLRRPPLWSSSFLWNLCWGQCLTWTLKESTGSLPAGSLVPARAGWTLIGLQTSGINALGQTFHFSLSNGAV